MSDNSFEYITTDYMVSVNPIEDTQSPTVEYIVELGQQGLPGAKGEPGEPGFSPVVTSVIDDNTIRFTLVNKDEVSTTPNFYDLLAKKDLSNTTYSDDMANKLDKNGANADSPITLNKLIITGGTTTTADVYLSTTNNRNISINAPIRTTNNIQLSPSGTTGIVTYKGHELATLNDIPEVPDVSNFLNKDGSNAASTISLQNVSLTGNIQTVQPNFYISNNKASNGNITVNTYDGDIYLSPDSNHKLYYRNKEIATLSDIPTVGNGVITIKQGDVTKGTFTTNQSGNAIIELDEGGGGSSYTAGNGIDITNDTISIDDTVALISDIPDVSNFVTNTSLATTLASYVTSANLTTILTNYALTSQIPTVNNSTITITQGGVTKGSFTTNQSSNQTIELDAGGGGGGVTNPIALSETIGGNTYNLNIGIDKTTGNLQGTYSYPVSGGTDTLPLFSRSYGLINAGLSNNYTTVNGYQTNQLSVKVDNSTIGFDSNGALTVTGSYASASDLDDKVSKSGDTMTGTLDIDTDSIALNIPTDARRYEDSGYFQDIQYQYNDIRTGVIRSIASDDGKREIILGVMDTTGSYKASLALVRESDNTLYARCPTPADNQNNTKIVTGAYLKKHVDGQWVSKVVDVVDSVTMNNTTRSVSVNSVLPDDGRIYEVLFNATARTGTTSGNYAILALNGNVAGGCEVGRVITRSASYANVGGSCIIPCRHGTNISLTITSNANVTNINVTARAYRRVGINT